ncbi:hypothetical protein [Nonomuraea sp. NPDC001023]|uniref:hypothetical protein n=1 Tax=unclassified Nonomuraea TaxID=2593643 RepID=UPI00332D45DE
MDWASYLPPAWVVWIAGGALALAVVSVPLAMLWGAWKTRGKTAKPVPVEDKLTWFIAAIATSVSASGMWKFAGDVLKLDGFWRALFFAFIEGAIVISALRARRSMRENYTAGLDGIAVWALAALTAVLASIDARSLGEVVFRLSAPLVAAWLWERGMRLERRKLRGMSGIHWRITPERLLVRLGLAEARDRSTTEVDAHRRLTRVALAAKKVHQLRAIDASPRKVRKASAALDRRLDEAVAHTGLARDDRMKWALLDQVGTLGGAESLCDLLSTAAGPWAQTDHPLVTGAAKHHEAVQLAEAMREWTDAINRQRDPETSSAIKSMAAYIAQLEGRPAPQFETEDETRPPVDDQVEGEVSQAAIDELINNYRETANRAPDETGNETADETRATEAMWAHWQQVVEVERRIPTGTELANAGGCTPQYGARMRTKWLEAMDGRTRRALLPGKRNGS